MTNKKTLEKLLKHAIIKQNILKKELILRKKPLTKGQERGKIVMLRQVQEIIATVRKQLKQLK